MAASVNDSKLSDSTMVVDDSHSGDQEEETGFTESDVPETVAFLRTSQKADDVEARNFYEKSPDHRDNDDKFYGLTREELEKYANDPKWVKIRRILLAILLVGWVAMLVSAIVIVVVTEKCPPDPKLLWYQDGVAYRIETKKFQDSNGDGIGDFTGVLNRADHFAELSVKSVWLEDMASRMTFIDSKIDLVDEVGTIDDFKDLAKTLKKRGIRVGVGLNYTNAVFPVDGNVSFVDMVKFWADAGAELFVISAADDILHNIKECQALLDDEYNKRDDRNRVVISGDGVKEPYFTSAPTALYTPNYECPDEDSTRMCEQNTLNFTGNLNNDPQWRAINIDYDLGSDACNLALRLTIPGTPNVMYGAEIGLPTDGFMVWDDSETSGFTSRANWTVPTDQKVVASVLAQSAAGFTGTSVYSLFKDLALVRAEEKSLEWGVFGILDFGDQVRAYIRHAEGHSPVVVALNPSEGKAGSLVNGTFTQGEVLVTSGIDLPVGEIVELDAIFIPKDGVFVAKMIDPTAKKKIIG